MRKYSKSVLFALFVLLAVGAIRVTHAGERLESSVKTHKLNEWQTLISCKSGKTPKVSGEIAGSLVISCEMQEK
jgi:hypothetical protein